jgi:hypothetical protein
MVDAVKYDKKHVGNIRLSNSKKAISVHIFNPERFYSVPVSVIGNKVGKVTQFVNQEAQIAGEIIPPNFRNLNSNKNFWLLKINNEMFHIKKEYIDILVNNSNLVLGIYEE